MQDFARYSEEFVHRGPVFERGDLFIYALLDPADETVRYIGITISPAKRLQCHRENDCKNRDLRAWLESLPNGPLLRVLSTVSRGCWKKAEKSWISYARSQGRVFNLHDGGSSSAFWAKEPKPQPRKKRRKRNRRKRPKHLRIPKPGSPRRVKRVKDKFGLWIPTSKGRV